MFTIFLLFVGLEEKGRAILGWFRHSLHHHQVSFIVYLHPIQTAMAGFSSCAILPVDLGRAVCKTRKVAFENYSWEKMTSFSREKQEQSQGLMSQKSAFRCVHYDKKGFHNPSTVTIYFKPLLLLLNHGVLIRAGIAAWGGKIQSTWPGL